MTKANAKFMLLIILFLSLLGCGNEYAEKGSVEYINSIKEWHQKRVETLKTNSIWLKLAGLHWLEEGKNTFGSSKDNKLIFPEDLPDVMGTIIKEGENIKLKVKDDITITVDNKPVNEIDVFSDMTGKPTVMKYKNYSWYIIKRGDDRYGIRLIDEEHPDLKSFTGIPTFPINEDWKIKGRWIDYHPVRTIETPSVIGTSSVDSLFGAVVFSVEGKQYKLQAPGKSENLFMIFADETSGEETYGAGRFLVVQVDYETKEVIIDFNKATNPPCTFSKYATCPLPPEGNRLSLRVTAGEKFEGHH